MTCSEKYYISLLIEAEDKKLLNLSINAVGLDLGVKAFVVDSDGKSYENPKYFKKLEGRLAFEQRKLSHMQKGSNNWNKFQIILFLNKYFLLLAEIYFEMTK